MDPLAIRQLLWVSNSDAGGRVGPTRLPSFPSSESWQRRRKHTNERPKREPDMPCLASILRAWEFRGQTMTGRIA